MIGEGDIQEERAIKHDGDEEEHLVLDDQSAVYPCDWEEFLVSFVDEIISAAMARNRPLEWPIPFETFHEYGVSIRERQRKADVSRCDTNPLTNKWGITTCYSRPSTRH